MKDHTMVRVAEVPDCDICRVDRGVTTPAMVDGRTTLGPWAYMCADCYETWGTGLGLGCGQTLVTP